MVGCQSVLRLAGRRAKLALFAFAANARLRERRLYPILAYSVRRIGAVIRRQGQAWPGLKPTTDPGFGSGTLRGPSPPLRLLLPPPGPEASASGSRRAGPGLGRGQSGLAP